MLCLYKLLSEKKNALLVDNGFGQGRLFEKHQYDSVIPIVRINDVKKHPTSFNLFILQITSVFKESYLHSYGAEGQRYNFATVAKFSKYLKNVGF